MNGVNRDRRGRRPLVAWVCGGAMACAMAAGGIGCSGGDQSSGQAAGDGGAKSTASVSSAPATATHATPDLADFPLTVTSNDGAFLVACRPAPDPIPLNQPFSLELLVLDAADRRPVGSSLSIVVDADMPDHRHGMNTQPVVSRRQDGSCRVEGMLFHMPGYWEIYVDLERDGVIERAQFPVNLE